MWGQSRTPESALNRREVALRQRTAGTKVEKEVGAGSLIISKGQDVENTSMGNG